MKQFNFNIFFVWGWHPCFARYPPWQNFPRNFNQFPSFPQVFRLYQLLSGRRSWWEKCSCKETTSLQGKESTQKIVKIETYPWNLHHYPTCWPCWGVIDRHWTIAFSRVFFQRLRGLYDSTSTVHQKYRQAIFFWVDTPSSLGLSKAERTKNHRVRSEIFCPDLWWHTQPESKEELGPYKIFKVQNAAFALPSEIHDCLFLLCILLENRGIFKQRDVKTITRRILDQLRWFVVRGFLDIHNVKQARYDT